MVRNRLLLRSTSYEVQVAIVVFFWIPHQVRDDKVTLFGMTVMRYGSAIKTGGLVGLLVVLFFLAFVGIFVIQDYLEEGRPSRDFVLGLSGVVVFVLYFVWFYSRTRRLYANWGRFFGISVLFAFIGEMTIGYGQVETVMAGKYLEFVAVVFHYLVLGTIVFYLNLGVRSNRIYYLLVFIIGVYLIEVLLLRNMAIGIPSLFMVLAASFYWALSVYPRYFSNPNISRELKRKRLTLMGVLAFVSVFVIAPVMMFGFGLRQPDLMLYGITFVPTHLLCIGIGVVFYGLLFFVDFVPDIIKGGRQISR